MFALSPDEWEIIQLSLKVAFWSVLCSLPLAVAVAFLLARAEFPGKSVFDALVHLPLVLPPVVVGYFLLLLLGRRGPLGALLDEYLGIVVAFRWSGAAIAAGIMGFPLMVRAIRLSIEAIDAGLEDAARTLGATRLRVFFSVTLPLALPGVFTRHAAVVCTQSRRIRCNHYVCLEHSGRDTHAAAGDIYADAGARWRRRGIAPEHHCHRAVGHRADVVGMAGATVAAARAGPR